MSSLSTLNRNMTRIAGLNSGMDTEKLISDMMKIDQMKVDRQFRAQAKMEWKVDLYKEINNELRKFKDEFSTVTKQAQNLLSAYNYRNYTTKYAKETNSAYATIQAQPYAKEGSYELEIYQIATADSISSKKRMTGEGGEGFKLSMTMKEVNEALNNAGAAGNGYIFATDNNGMITFELNNRRYEFSEYATLDSVINAVNASDPDLKLSYSQLEDKFTISARQTGSKSTLGDGSIPMNSFMYAILGNVTAEDIKEGQDATFSINGIHATRSTNNFEIDGLVYTLKKPTAEILRDENTAEGRVIETRKLEDFSVSIERDLDATVDLIKKYVDTYNGLMEKLRGIVSEKADKKYFPLTEDEKSGLSEKEIERWESEAKKGLMRSDSQLNNLMMKMRQSFYTKIPGTNLMMSDIGLSTATWTANDPERAKNGVIEVDETKLRKALTDNPDMVFRMFTYDDSETGLKNVDNMGLVSRLNTLMDNYVKYNERETQYYANMDIARAKEKYVDMVEAMYKKEEQMWARFTAMETAMSKLNAQNAWLQQQLGLSTASS